MVNLYGEAARSGALYIQSVENSFTHSLLGQIRLQKGVLLNFQPFSAPALHSWVASFDAMLVR